MEKPELPYQFRDLLVTETWSRIKVVFKKHEKKQILQVVGPFLFFYDPNNIQNIKQILFIPNCICKIDVRHPNKQLIFETLTGFIDPIRVIFESKEDFKKCQQIFNSLFARVLNYYTEMDLATYQLSAKLEQIESPKQTKPVMAILQVISNRHNFQALPLSGSSSVKPYTQRMTPTTFVFPKLMQMKIKNQSFFIFGVCDINSKKGDDVAFSCHSMIDMLQWVLAIYITSHSPEIERKKKDEIPKPIGINQRTEKIEKAVIKEEIKKETQKVTDQPKLFDTPAIKQEIEQNNMKEPEDEKVQQETKEIDQIDIQENNEKQQNEIAQMDQTDNLLQNEEAPNDDISKVELNQEVQDVKTERNEINEKVQNEEESQKVNKEEVVNNDQKPEKKEESTENNVIVEEVETRVEEVQTRQINDENKIEETPESKINVNNEMQQQKEADVKKPNNEQITNNEQQTNIPIETNNIQKPEAPIQKEEKINNENPKDLKIEIEYENNNNENNIKTEDKKEANQKTPQKLKVTIKSSAPALQKQKSLQEKTQKNNPVLEMSSSNDNLKDSQETLPDDVIKASYDSQPLDQQLNQFLSEVSHFYKPKQVNVNASNSENGSQLIFTNPFTFESFIQKEAKKKEDTINYDKSFVSKSIEFAINSYEKALEQSEKERNDTEENKIISLCDNIDQFITSDDLINETISSISGNTTVNISQFFDFSPYGIQYDVDFNQENPKCPIVTELSQVCQYFFGSGKTAHTEGPMTNKFLFLICSIFLNGFKKESKAFFNAMKDLSHSVPELVPIVQNLFDVADNSNSQCSYVVSKLVVDNDIQSVLRILLRIDLWAEEYYHKTAMIRNDSALEEALTIIDTILNAHTFEISPTTNLLQMSLAETISQIKSNQSQSSSQSNSDLRADKIRFIDTPIYVYLSSQNLYKKENPAAVIKKMMVAGLKHKTNFLQQIVSADPFDFIVECANNIKDTNEITNEFITTIKRINTQNSSLLSTVTNTITSSVSKIDQWIDEALRSKHLHLWLCLLASQHSIAANYYNEEGVLYDYFRAKYFISQVYLYNTYRT